MNFERLAINARQTEINLLRLKRLIKKMKSIVILF